MLLYSRHGGWARPRPKDDTHAGRRQTICGSLLLLEARERSLVLKRLKSEIDVGRDGDVEGAELVWLVSSRHDHVTICVAVQNELFVVLAPRHEFKRVLIDHGVLRRLNLIRVYIEANHGADQRHADLLLPGLLWPAKRNFDGRSLISYEFEQELGVLHPGEGVRLLLVLLVVEVAASSVALFPSRGKHDISAIR